MLNLASEILHSRLVEIDWDFSGDYSESPFSAVHWHPGRFASQIPAGLISSLTQPGDVVLDPYSGSGTTLVEAQRLGRRGLGIDLNPISCLIARAKTLEISSDKVLEAIDRLRLAIQARPEVFLEENRDWIPPAVQAVKWYSPGVRRQLAGLWRLLSEVRDPLASLLGRFAFSGVLLECCRETRHWGYVCDNTQPRTHREVQVIDRCFTSLARLGEAYRYRDNERRELRAGPLYPAQVMEGDASELLGGLPSGSVSLVVTSPPYFGVCDYIKAQRLAFEWMGLSIEAHRLKETGARSKRHRRKARHEYLADLRRALVLAVRTIELGGRLAMVIGESSDRERVVEDLLSMLVHECRLSIEFKTERFVSLQRRQAPSIRTEWLVVLRKDRGDCGATERLG